MLRNLLFFLLTVLVIACGTDQSQNFEVLQKRFEEKPGCNCAKGGYSLAEGQDVNGNGTLDNVEIETVTYKCIKSKEKEEVLAFLPSGLIIFGVLFLVLAVYSTVDHLRPRNKNQDQDLIDDANCLINWGLKRHVTIKDEDVKKVLAFESLKGDSNHKNYLTFKEEFLKALRNISDQLRAIEFDGEPVNVPSIIDIQKKSPVRIFFYLKLPLLRVSKAIRTLIHFQIWLFVVLILALSIQFYWFNGTSYYSDYVRLVEKIASTKNGLALNPSDSLQKVLFKENIDQYKSQKDDVLRGLCKWEAAASYDPDDKQRFNFANLSCCEHNEGGIDKIEDRLIRSVKIKLSLCDSYLLPLLYGLLGAIVFSLRNITYEIAHYKLRSTSKNRYLTRLYLGAFAGIAIGWFGDSFSSEILTFEESLTPIVLSFIAGYSIEVFFNLIDRNIKSDKKISEE